MLHTDHLYVGHSRDLDLMFRAYSPIQSTDTFWEKCGKIVALSRSSLDAIAKKYCHLLDTLENVVVVFNSPEVTQIQTLFLQKCLRYLSIFEGTPINQRHLSRRIIALKYRFEEVNGGTDRLLQAKINPILQEELKAAAAKWKISTKTLQNKSLTDADLLKLHQACCYPEFALLLLKDRALLKSFFSWILRDHCPVAPFVEFPALATRLKKAHLAVRVGRFGENLLALVKRKAQTSDCFEKILTLPFYIEGKIQHVDLLNDLEEVVLNDNLRISIRKVIECFAKKNEEVGDLEFFASRGIMNWNCQMLSGKNGLTGQYQPIDLDQICWWDQLPIFQILTLEEVSERCGEALQKGDWVVFAMGSRQTQDLDFAARHGYMEVAIPRPQGDYLLLPFGKLAQKYPKGAWQYLTFILNTVPSKIHYPDENEFYTHREHASYPVKMTREEGLVLMDYIKADLIRSHEGNLFFQFACENCAFWVQHILSKVKQVPNLFRLHLLKSRPSNFFIGGVLGMIRFCPESWHSTLISGTDRLLGSKRGITVIEKGQKAFKSVYTHPMRDYQSIFQVGYLFQQIIDKSLSKGTIKNAY